MYLWCTRQGRENERYGDAWEEVGAAANFRCPREEERDT